MQEELAGVVFQRTALAKQTLRQSANNIPRRLRTLLYAVDGRSTVALYVPFLFNLAPLSPKLRELELLGMLERLSPSGPEPMDTLPQAPMRAVESLDSDTHAAIETVFQPVVAESVARQDTAFDGQMAQLERLLDGVSSPGQATNGADADTPIPAALTLEGVLSAMERYLGKRKGLDALPIALMLERIQSVQQLQHELPDYAALLEPHDEETRQHLQGICQALAPFKDPSR